MLQLLRRVLPAGLLLPLLFGAPMLAGCSTLGSTDNASNAGKDAAGKAVNGAKQGAEQVQFWATTNGRLVAAIIIALVGTVFLRYLWKSQAVRYLVIIAIVVGFMWAAFH